MTRKIQPANAKLDKMFEKLIFGKSKQKFLKKSFNFVENQIAMRFYRVVYETHMCCIHKQE